MRCLIRRRTHSRVVKGKERNGSDIEADDAGGAGVERILVEGTRKCALRLPFGDWPVCLSKVIVALHARARTALKCTDNRRIAVLTIS